MSWFWGVCPAFPVGPLCCCCANVCLFCKIFDAKFERFVFSWFTLFVFRNPVEIIERVMSLYHKVTQLVVSCWIVVCAFLTAHLQVDIHSLVL